MKTLQSAATKSALGLAALVSGVQTASAATVPMRTELSSNILSADGSTIYTMKVRINTSEFPTQKFMSWGWQIFPPSYISIYNSTLPTSNDFFEGFTQEQFYKNNVTWNGFSERTLLPNIIDGANREGVLGEFKFRVKTTAPLGPNSLTASNIRGCDLNDTAYTYPTKVRKVDDVFTIAMPGDANLDQKVDVSDLGTLATNWQKGISIPIDAPMTWRDGDYNYDGKIDVSDLGIIATNWQRGVAGSGLNSASFSEAIQMYPSLNSPVFDSPVPEPSALLLAGASLAGLLSHRKPRN